MVQRDKGALLFKLYVFRATALNSLKKNLWYRRKRSLPSTAHTIAIHSRTVGTGYITHIVQPHRPHTFPWLMRKPASASDPVAQYQEAFPQAKKHNAKTVVNFLSLSSSLSQTY